MPDYVIDLDPIHLVLRVTPGKVVTNQVALDAYHSLKRLAAHGGPYATITDCSGVQELKLSADTVRSLGHEAPAVPGERPRVVVVNRLVMYALVDMFASMRSSMGLQFNIVWSPEAAHALLGVSPESFSQPLFPESPVGVMIAP
jgi:hypothetical protein